MHVMVKVVISSKLCASLVPAFSNLRTNQSIVSTIHQELIRYVLHFHHLGKMECLTGKKLSSLLLANKVQQVQVCSIDTYVLFVHSENFHAQLWCSSQGSFKEDTESIVYTIKEVNCASGIFTAAAICSHATHSMVLEVWKRALVNTELLFTANNTLPKQGILMTSCW